MLNRISLIFILIATLSCKKKEVVTEKKLYNKSVIAHRGASGYLPEHTLASKAMAHAMNPDYLEQDIVLSKDGIPVVFHDIHLDEITDVAQKFPNRKREDSRFYVIDFTIDELKTLELVQRMNPKTGKAKYPQRFPTNNSTFRIHTLEEEIAFIQGLNYSTGKNIGIYPEIKEPAFHKKEGKDISSIVLEILRTYNYETGNDNCILQCFDPVELKRIREKLNCELTLVQLIEMPISKKELEEIGIFANGIGPWYKPLIKKEDGKLEFSSLVKEAQDAGLFVHAYTFRADDLEDFKTFDELLKVGFYDLNLDGIFTDFPDKAVEFLKAKE